MTMVSTGEISIGGNATSGGLNRSVNIELGRSATATSSLNESALRTLAGVPSGAISLSSFYGKANEFTFTISSNVSNANLATLATNAGWNGTSKVVATIAANVYVFSTSTGTPALTVPNSFPNGVDIINNGNICGRGGAGGAQGAVGAAGGSAISILRNVTITNNSYIAGGGGGGGGGQGVGAFNDYGTVIFAFGNGGGGGGAGGGSGGSARNLSGGSGGSPTSTTGSNGPSNDEYESGTLTYQYSYGNASGGGGGFALPGTGGASRTGQRQGGAGGSAGGSGGRAGMQSPLSSSTVGEGIGGGGGGWGAAGGLGGGKSNAPDNSASSGAGGSAGNAGGNRGSFPGMSSVSGGAGGNAVALNGFSVTWVATGTRYGAIA